MMRAYGRRLGTGLRLAIAKKAVDLLDREIVAMSEVGESTTFTPMSGTDGWTND